MTPDLRCTARRAFRADVLQRVCELDDFTSYAPRVDLPGTDRFFHYRDNGAGLLAVAHLDTVQPDRTCRVVRTAGGLLAVSGALDDRLGAYVILDLLPRLGVTADWLLTTGEERGCSTAAEFVAAKQYQWMFEFDRGGTDVVLYDYDTPDLRARVVAAGARVGQGSFSDICDLQHLGCAGLNWGVGYRDYHSKRSHAWLTDTFAMVGRFLAFHAAHCGTSLPHTPHFPWRDIEGLTDVPSFGQCPACVDPLVDGYCPECDVDWFAAAQLTV